MYIGEIARRAGTTPKAIRHYEALGLLGAVPRRGRYRIYADKALRQVLLIRQAQTLGFRLADLGTVLKGTVPEPDWDSLLRQIEIRRAALQQQMVDLQTQDAQLVDIDDDIRQCLAAQAAAEHAGAEASSTTTAPPVACAPKPA